MEDNLTTYLIAAFVLLFVILIIARWIFLIDKSVRMQIAQVKLLAEIAFKSGVDTKRINAILYKADDRYEPRNELTNDALRSEVKTN